MFLWQMILIIYKKYNCCEAFGVLRGRSFSHRPKTLSTQLLCGNCLLQRLLRICYSPIRLTEDNKKPEFKKNLNSGTYLFTSQSLSCLMDRLNILDA